MAIKIAALEALSKQTDVNNYYYKDLHLDITKDKLFNPITQQNIEQNDLKVAFDYNAIRNSLRNLFTTRPGERFLFPLYGLDLTRYLFESVSKTVAELIGNDISTAIRQYEPRITLKKCLVVANEDANTYEITLIVEIPLFNTSETINTLLDVKTQKFTFIS